MRSRAILLAAFVLATPALSSAPASAAGGTVEAAIVAVNQNLGNGVVSLALCSAHATQSGPLEVPVVTSVWCEINGFQSATVSMPGPDAAVVNGNATSRPIQICVHALAVFSPTIGAPYTDTDTICQTF